MQAQWAKLLFVLTALESTTGMNHPAGGRPQSKGAGTATRRAARSNTKPQGQQAPARQQQPPQQPPGTAAQASHHQPMTAGAWTAAQTPWIAT